MVSIANIFRNVQGCSKNLNPVGVQNFGEVLSVVHTSSARKEFFVCFYTQNLEFDGLVHKQQL